MKTCRRGGRHPRKLLLKAKTPKPGEITQPQQCYKNKIASIMHDAVHGEEPNSSSSLCKGAAAISHLVLRAPPLSLAMLDVFGD